MSAFTKHDGGKSRLDLVPPTALDLVGRVLGFGAAKYTDDNWRKVDDRRRYLGAALRHLNAWAAGENVDPESGMPHLAHAVCSAMFLLEADEHDLGDDTRPTSKERKP